MTRWPECMLEIALYCVCAAVVITFLFHAFRGWQAHQSHTHHDQGDERQDDERQDDEPPPISMVRTTHRAARADRRAP